VNPGSGNIDLWPIEQMHGLFRLLGERGAEPIGVRLTESSLMVPNKSIAGMLFASAKSDYESCAYCDRELAEGDGDRFLCVDCLARLGPATWHGCRRCAGEVLDCGFVPERCLLCRNTPLKFDAAVAHPKSSPLPHRIELVTASIPPWR